MRGAPDDVLPESLGLPNVERWGWPSFMVRELNWVMLLAANWGHPGIRGECGGNRGAAVFADVDERRVQAALYLVDYMRDRGYDPVAALRYFSREAREELGVGEGSTSRGCARAWSCTTTSTSATRSRSDPRRAAPPGRCSTRAKIGRSSTPRCGRRTRAGAEGRRAFIESASGP